MKKRMLLSLCTAVLSALLLLAAFPAAALATETIVLTTGEPYITAIAGETVDLTRYAVTLNGATAAPESLVWKNGGQAVTSFTPAGAGVYPLTAESGGASATIYVVAKNESDAEYVLYANDFADADALSGLRFITGGAALCEIEDGALVLDATTLNGPEVAVLLPEWLDAFGSYRVEASVAVRNTADDSCWSSLTFRTQSDGRRCYQMLVRRNAAAADGLRLRMRTIAQEWQTMATARAGSALNEGEYHTYAVEVKGSAMRGCLDDMPLLYSNALSAYSEGGLGLCVQYGRMYVDELRVTVQENTPTQPADPALTETSKASPVASALGFYAVYNSGSIEACLNGAQGVVVSVDEELRVCETSGGTPVYTLDELFAKLDGNAFPIFTPYGDADIARPLALYLKYANRADAAYMDSDGDAIRTAREIYPYLRGIYRAEAGMTAAAITDAALTATAQTAALPTALCTQETVAALQSALLTVAACPAETNETALMDAAASGANIVIAPSASAARNAAASLGSTTTTRAPLLIGAAGSPSLAPENSLSSFSAAVNAGAGAILADVRLTADGVPVIMKDETIDRTTSGSGRVNAMTLNAIKQYKLWGENNAFSASHPNETVPSLAELLQRFRTSQTRILLDLRSTEPELAQAVADCIEQQGMTGRVVCISANAYTLTTLRAALPGLQCALKLGAPRRDFDHQQRRGRAGQAACARAPGFRAALQQLRQRHVRIHRRSQRARGQSHPLGIRRRKHGDGGELPQRRRRAVCLRRADLHRLRREVHCRQPHGNDHRQRTAGFHRRFRLRTRRQGDRNHVGFRLLGRVPVRRAALHDCERPRHAQIRRHLGRPVSLCDVDARRQHAHAIQPPGDDYGSERNAVRRDPVEVEQRIPA